MGRPSQVEMAAIRLERHLQKMRDVKASYEQCERLLSDAGPCWKVRVNYDDHNIRDRDGHLEFSPEELRAELTAEHYCEPCCRNEPKVREWYRLRRSVGAYRAALVVATRRLMLEVRP